MSLPSTKSEKIKRIVFLTPILPIKTGPSIYFNIFFETFLEVIQGIKNFDILIVIDKEDFPHREMPKDYQNFPVLNYPEYSARSSDLIILSLANNHYHHYCWHFLLHYEGQNLVSVIHDVQCYMNLRGLLFNTRFNLKYSQFVKFFSGELPPSFFERNKLKIQQDNVNFVTKFLMMGQSITREKSKCIIVHSIYAKLKLEYEITSAYLPRFHVTKLPALHPELNCNVNFKKEDDLFVMLAIGWVSPMKRIDKIIYALKKFRNQYPFQKVKFKILGAISNDLKEDLTSVVNKMALETSVDFYGFVEDQVLVREIQSADLIFSLRFPSCGETSGAISSVAEHPVPIVTTNYASFIEIDSFLKVNVGPSEVDEIFFAMKATYQYWLKYGRTSDLSSKPKESANYNTLSKSITEFLGAFDV